MTNPRGLPLGESIHFGWTTLKTAAIFIVGVTLAAWLIPTLIEEAGKKAFEHGPRHFGMSLIVYAVSSTFCLGLAKIYLRFRDGEKPIFENLFDGLARLHVYIGATVIAGIAVVMGMVLLIVPGIIFMIRLWFVGFVVVDERTGPLDAIQRSWDITRGHTMDLLLLFLLLVGLNLLGAVCLGVGLLATVPMSGLALAYIYRYLKPKAAEPVPAEATAPAAQ
ncbi:MAG TPA: hypothetical protein VFX92_02545 [Candidatus Krumholzibacteria bacterium]|nr:hypothetical protein [Candidatus Krumholzibacteria bacterium]